MPFKSLCITVPLRKIHALTALLAAVFILILSVSGALLAISPVSESINSMHLHSGSERDISLAQLAENSSAHFPAAEQIVRSATGQVIVYYMADNGEFAADIINPLTGQAIAPYGDSPSLLDEVRYFHRSLMLNDVGRMLVGITSGLLLVVLISGIPLLAKCLGGWKRLFKPLKGTPASCLHAFLARILLLPLLLTSLSGVYLSLVRFEYLPGDELLEPDYPVEISAGKHLPVQSLQALQAVNLAELRELRFPYPGDPEGLFFVHTDKGQGYVDPVTGQWLNFQPHSSVNKIYEFVYAVHTGEGLWWLVIFLALAALLTPVMLFTGIDIWWRRRQRLHSKQLQHNAPPEFADSVILVGSEGHSSWPFAQILHHALLSAGLKVHCNDMNHIAHYYPNAQHILILTSTYGDGCPPASAALFEQRLQQIEENARYHFAVLGFGDRQYPNFCGFALHIEKLLISKGWQPLLPIELIDRKSPQAFARWGKLLSAKLHKDFVLNYIPERPKTITLTLVKRQVYAAQSKMPIVILRFCAQEDNKLPKFSVGDLLGIFPPIQAAQGEESDTAGMARFYSIGSCEKEGFIELGISVHEQGLCSNALFALKMGATIEAFVKTNESFHHRGSGKPLLLIGAGTGIVPLMGFIRNNHAHHPIYLYWGGRDPACDYIYQDELSGMLASGHLTELRVAFSRGKAKTYVQDLLREDKDKIRQLLLVDAEIMICGGREMAAGVEDALELILSATNMSLAEIKNAHRYREDVY